MGIQLITMDRFERSCDVGFCHGFAAIQSWATNLHHSPCWDFVHRANGMGLALMLWVGQGKAHALRLWNHLR
jgi:hypothetical protein